MTAAAKSVLAAALALAALVAGGCTVGASSPRAGGAELAVTRDFGADTVLRAREDPIPGGETAMRLLLRNAKVDSRYGGRFVNGVNGIRSRNEGDRRSDWFYYVNGIEAGVGAAERDVERGDRVWWDYHDWTGAMRVPAVVGSFPEPFLHGSEGKLFPVRIDCAQNARRPCDEVARRLDRAGVQASTTAIGAGAGKNVLRVVVGEWSDARRDSAAEQIEQGLAKSGVFARFGAGGSRYELDLLDEQGRVSRTLGAGAGLVAATRFEEQQPTWVVAGTDAAGLERAVGLLDVRVLRDRFAVATAGGGPLRLPLTQGGGG
jgi:uncharacterized protein DUF4430